ncbi:MAG: pyrroline-5-carboxylate reductase [Deltaproteobacteria bacterium RIFCSPLOWO2_12_FULL_40_28]|nr:MAG: pyrroline-5-carboxylate reductase [Deltaproteobacteria bacterium RIFCSPHIGHO2_02_FULL_40_28]OGQ18806.1 MAG: pyrroline-5-carboxylate reductase [Deltaproteobacteria bacterium RIFCSPHIGHO2_12_FULL_40_32]OGQ40051.1 MAG: pyrroline-5-carboxylate reductase [Deltaproteobacteria bacterium RIFCSPLOWO2_02_FULL_40_36]OGQ53234.1 MAG: pyrroline-5-carboxylate reductase [Deltaproteobacteria bacterium RIFCSPLOWO2_12_FULL_40_28]
MKTLGIIGTGNMAEAIVGGILAKKIFKPQNIIGFDIDLQKLNSFTKKFRIQKAKTPLEITKANIILLAVKPQNMGEALQTLSPLVSKKNLVLTIAAGLPLKFFRKKLGNNPRIIRLMPNTPALVGLGATAFIATPNCTKKDIQKTQKIFSAIGMVIKIKNEKQMDAITALSGSGPAYVYLFVKSLIEGGQQLGLSSELTRTLSLQTVKGALELLSQSKENPKTLIGRVASKGGTTEAGLKILTKKGFESMIFACLKAAQKRAFELSKMGENL